MRVTFCYSNLFCVIAFINFTTINGNDLTSFLNKRDGDHLERMNHGIDVAQASVEKNKERLGAVGSVIKDHVTKNPFVSDLHNAWTNEKSKKRDLSFSNPILIKRGVNDAIDRAQDKATRLGGRMGAVSNVVKQHVSNHPLVNDLHEAWRTSGNGHPTTQHKRDLSMMKREAISIDKYIDSHTPSKKFAKRGINDRIDRLQESATRKHDQFHAVKEVAKEHVLHHTMAQDLRNAWHGAGNPPNQATSPPPHKRDLGINKRDFFDKTNKAIDNAQQDATKVHNKIEAVERVVDDHLLNNSFSRDVKHAWNQPNKRSEQTDGSFIHLVRRGPVGGSGLKRAASALAEEVPPKKLIKTLERVKSSASSGFSSKHLPHTPHTPPHTPSSGSSASHHQPHTEFTRGRPQTRSEGGGRKTFQRSQSAPVRSTSRSESRPHSSEGMHMPKYTKTGAVATAAAIVGAAAANINVTPPNLTLNVQHSGRGRQLSMSSDLSEGMVNSNFNLAGTNVNMNRMTRSRSFGNGGYGGGMGGYAQEAY